MDLAGFTPGTKGTNALFQRNCPNNKINPSTTTIVITVTIVDRAEGPIALVSANVSNPAPVMDPIKADAFMVLLRAITFSFSFCLCKLQMMNGSSTAMLFQVFYQLSCLIFISFKKGFCCFG